MKNILLVSTGTNIGGIEKCMINLLKYFDTKDCEVDVCFWWDKGPMFKYLPASVNYIGRPGPGKFSDIFKQKNPFKIIKDVLWFAAFKLAWKCGRPWKAAKRIKKHYDIAISYTQGSNSPYYIIDKVDADKKYFWYQELKYIQFQSKKIDDKYFAKFDGIMCASDACRKNMIEDFPQISEKFITINYFYDVDEIRQKAEAEPNPYESNNKPVLATVGRLSQEKGVMLALQICEELARTGQEFTWYWIGEGPMHRQAQEWIDARGLGEKMILAGNRENPYPYVQHCDLYIQPSLSEGFCTTVIEALVLKKGMILTDVPSFYEQVHEGEDALIAPKEPQAFAAKIKEGLQYPFRFYETEEILNKTEKYDAIFFGE